MREGFDPPTRTIVTFILVKGFFLPSREGVSFESVKTRRSERTLRSGEVSRGLFLSGGNGISPFPDRGTGKRVRARAKETHGDEQPFCLVTRGTRA